MINQVDQSVTDQAANEAELVTDNQLISEKHNPLILNYPRPKIRHDYKQLHRKNFVKSAKFEPRHELITSKTFKQIINEFQTKEGEEVMQIEYNDQVKRGTFIITTSSYDVKSIRSK